MDTGCHRIQKFDEDWDFILEVGTEGWGTRKVLFTQKTLLLSRQGQSW